MAHLLSPAPPSTSPPPSPRRDGPAPGPSPSTAGRRPPPRLTLWVGQKEGSGCRRCAGEGKAPAPRVCRGPTAIWSR